MQHFLLTDFRNGDKTWTENLDKIYKYIVRKSKTPKSTGLRKFCTGTILQFITMKCTNTVDVGEAN